MSDPHWYKDAVFYELRVGAFHDSDGDGIGDFRGLTAKLDYLQDLGVTTLWVLPFYPSPLRDDGYDISDYTEIRPDCGTMRDFKEFLREAHQRGLRVVTELVLNHTSDQHPWFQRARRAAPGSSDRNFYVWSDSINKFEEARIIFKDFESSNWTWDPVAKQYYWHRFYSHQPDLNFDHPPLQKEIFKVLDFWLGLGVDGLRLDAVPYLIEREGTNCENLPETHAFLKKLRQHVDKKFKDRMLLAEANQWSEDAIAYLGDGDECHMAFHFPIMPRLFMSIQMEDRFPIVDILQQTPPIPDSCQWAIFLRNHDELTLEMVTDEERDYMYRVYATDPQARINLGIRRRLAPLLRNDRRKIELMNALLFSLPGTPVIYYGDEIGMGDNFFLGDRNGVRTPMQWSSDRNAGFSRVNPQRLYLPVNIDPEYHYETVNVEAQQDNPHSLLWWMKRLISLRRRYKAFGSGTIEFLDPKNRKVLAFLRRHGDEILLLVTNLSRFVQYVELDLAAFKGMTPVELFGQTNFPPVGELPYLLTLGPRAFYWFLLKPPTETSVSIATIEQKIPTISVSGNWESIFQKTGRGTLNELLSEYLKGRRWFRGKARRVKSARLQEHVPIPCGLSNTYLSLVHLDYREGAPETYLLPLSFASGEKADQIRQGASHQVIATLKAKEKGIEIEGILFDAFGDREFSLALLDAMRRRRLFRGESGTIQCTPTRLLKNYQEKFTEPNEIRPLKAEQSNTSVIFGHHLIFKLFRSVEEGTNPDLEIGRFLTEKTDFTHSPQVAGFIEYQIGRREPMTLGMLQQFIPNEGDTWQFTLDQVDNFFERALTLGRDMEEPLPNDMLSAARQEPSDLVKDLIGGYLETARLIGQRTGEMHRTLVSKAEGPHFSPEPFTALYQRSLYQSMRTLTLQAFHLLEDQFLSLPEEVKPEAQKVLSLQPKVLKQFQSILNRRITALRIRCHGDFHLGQLLSTGKDFMIFDFEGEPARPLSERRIKRSPFRDVTGMIRSFHYAAHAALIRLEARGTIPSERLQSMGPLADLWQTWVSGRFFNSYLEVLSGTALIPQSEEELTLLLNIYLLEKSIYELGYELNNRPDWVAIPLRGILKLMERVL